MCSGENIKMGNNTMAQEQMLMHSLNAAVSMSGLVFIIMFLVTILKLICVFKKKWRSPKDFDEEASRILNDLTLTANYQHCSIVAETAAMVGMEQKSASFENTETASVHGNTGIPSTTRRF